MNNTVGRWKIPKMNNSTIEMIYLNVSKCLSTFFFLTLQLSKRFLLRLPWSPAAFPEGDPTPVRQLPRQAHPQGLPDEIQPQEDEEVRVPAACWLTRQQLTALPSLSSSPPSTRLEKEYTTIKNKEMEEQIEIKVPDARSRAQKITRSRVCVCVCVWNCVLFFLSEAAHWEQAAEAEDRDFGEGERGVWFPLLPDVLLLLICSG